MSTSRPDGDAGGAGDAEPRQAGGPKRAATLGPWRTVRCLGEPRFRSRAARDLGCLLDVDPDVLAWRCLPERLIDGASELSIDIEVNRGCGTEYLIVTAARDNVELPPWTHEAAARRSAVIRIVPTSEIAGDRLENAREMLRYAGWRVSLSDRIRLLAALDQEGSLPLADCMSLMRNAVDPVGAIAALALRRFVAIDLDGGLLGPETRVSRFRV